MSDQIDIPRAVVLTAISIEYDAVLAHLTEVQKVKAQDRTSYRSGRFITGATEPECAEEWQVIVGRSGAGNVEAALLAKHLIDSFSPIVVIFVGVPGGLKREAELGDVIVASSVFYYESGKVTAPQNDNNNSQFLARPKAGQPSRKIFQEAVYQSDEPGWRKRIVSSAGPNISDVHVEPVVAGEKVLATKSSELGELIRKHHNKAIAVEMEGHGFLQAIYQSGVEGIVIRGISDFLDDKNASTEHGTDDERQRIAAANAAAFAFELLANLDLSSITSRPAAGKEKVTIKVEAELSPEEVDEAIIGVSRAVGGRNLKVLEVTKGSTIIVVESLPEPIKLLMSLHDGDILAEFLGSESKIIDRPSDLETSGLVTSLANLISFLRPEEETSSDNMDLVQENRWRKACKGIDTIAKKEPGLRWACIEVLAAFLHRAGLRRGGKYRISGVFTRATLGSISNILRTHYRSSSSAPSLARVDLRGCLFLEANLSNSYFRNADLRGAVLVRCNFESADLFGVLMDQADAREANFKNAVLRGASMRGANCVSCKFTYANLRSADLSEAILIAAKLDNANLSRANLRGADLRRANVSGAVFRNADMRDANIRRSNLLDADLRGALTEGIVGEPLDRMDWY